MLKRIELIILEDDVDDFFHEFATDILVYKKPIEGLLDQANNSKLNFKIIEPYITKLKEIFDHIIKLMQNTSDNYLLPKNFEKFIRENKVEIDSHKEWYKLVYEIVFDISFKPKPPSDKSGLGFSNFIPSLPATSFFRIKSPIISRDRIKEKKDLQGEIQILSGFRDEQIKILKDYGEISGLWSGLGVLIYACIVGIAIPSLLLPYQLNVYDDLTIKAILISLFFSQLIAIFAYLIISMHKLTRENQKA